MTPPITSDENLQRLTRLEATSESDRSFVIAQFETLRAHLDSSHGQLEKEIREIKVLLAGHMDRTDERLDELKLEVARHSWALRCVTAIAVPVIAAMVPVAFTHYSGPAQSVEPPTEIHSHG